MSDELAWELIAPDKRTAEPLTRTPHVVAVGGPGDAAHGAAIIAAVRGWHEREVWLESRRGAITLAVERQGKVPDIIAPTTVELHDATYWGTRAPVIAPPAGDSLAVTVAVASVGQLRVPLRNLVVPPDDAL